MEIKTAHFYWGEAKKMPFLNFLSVLTFRDSHPEWEVVLHTSKDSPKEPSWSTHEQRHIYDGKDYLDLCKTYCDRVVSVDFEDWWTRGGCGNMYDNINNIHDVHKADMLRQYLLYSVGGLWSDMDVLWLKPIEELGVHGVDITVVLSSVPTNGGMLCHSTGVMYSSGNFNTFYNDVLEEIKKTFNSSGYQAAGPGCLNILYPNMETINSKHGHLKFTTLPYRVFYPYSPCTCTDFFRVGAEDLVGDDVVAAHWFNGHQEVGKLACYITPDNVREYEGSPFFTHVERFL